MSLNHPREGSGSASAVNEYAVGLTGQNQGIEDIELFESNDWTYSMRREMQEIISGLFVGPYSSASKTKLNSLMSSGITHIICIRHSSEAHIIKPNFPENFTYLIIDLADTMVQNIIPSILKCNKFIEKCLNGGGKCLVHSYLGISRSPAIVTAFIMSKNSFSFRKALSLVKSIRNYANPNEHFLKQLSEYEAIYKAEQLSSQGECSRANGKFKRKFDTDKDDEPMDQSPS